jgi:hypothetical protein
MPSPHQPRVSELLLFVEHGHLFERRTLSAEENKALVMTHETAC